MIESLRSVREKEDHMSYLRVESINKSYGETRVLHDVSFGLPKGECLALLGPSGCGKSTLLNIIAGLLPADSGQIYQDSRLIEDGDTGFSLSAQERRFAMVFQDLSLWPHMTIAENTAFGLEHLGIDRATIQDKVEEALRRVGIYELRHRMPSTLSGGQQQRVAIARAVVVEPSVLLMDEPLASLDTNLREELRDEIASLIRRLGITTLYVTHDQTEAMTVAHHVCVMNEGRIEQMAGPREIYEFPATTFTAAFLGNANCFPYTHELEVMRLPGGEKVFPPHPPKVRRGHLLIRRELVRIFPFSQGPEFPEEGLVQWRAVCQKNIFTGERNEVHAVTSKGEVFRGFTTEPLPLDSEVIVEFDPKNVTFVED